jgi:hypothetical protein
MVPRGIPQLVLGPTEDVVPEAGFKVIFQLGQVEVRPADAVQLPSRAMEEVEPEVDQAPRHGLSVHQNVALRKMPSARPHDDCRYVFAQTVFRAGIRGEIDAPVESIDDVQLTGDDVVPRG